MEEVNWTNSTPITVEELDEIIKTYRMKRVQYEKAKEESTLKYNEMHDYEKLVLEALERSGKKSYKLDNVGTVYKTERYVVRTPKELEALRQLRAYAESKYGVDFADAMFTVNHMTLNKFYNTEMEQAEESGNTSFKVPGLDDPTCEISLGFRK